MAEVSPLRAAALAQALEVLVALGFKHKQAQAMVDRAKPHVGSSPKVDDVVRLALKHAPLPASIGRVRESEATYQRIAA